MWHLAVNGKPVRYESLTDDQIRSFVSNGTISQETLCWNAAEGGDWKPLRGTQLDEIIYRIVGQREPPPIPTTQVAPAAVEVESPKGGIDAKGVILVLVCLGVVGIVLMASYGQNRSTTSSSAPQTTQQVRETLAAPSMPSDQLNFVSTVTESRNRYTQSRGNEMAQGAIRPERAARLCQMGYPRSVYEWVGTIRQATTNGEGRGVISIEIAPEIYVKTWNNALSDIGDNTLLDPTSPVFQAASGMRVGQRVRFSGAFLRGRTDCVNESSMTMDGSMRKPEFLMRFTSLTRL